jgi:hypothetical protein
LVPAAGVVDMLLVLRLIAVADEVVGAFVYARCRWCSVHRESIRKHRKNFVIR